MPAQSLRRVGRPDSVYEQVCRLSTLHERTAASAMVERLVDAGVSYAEAAAAVRDRRAVPPPYARGPVASPAPGVVRFLAPCCRRRRADQTTATMGGRF